MATISIINQTTWLTNLVNKSSSSGENWLGLNLNRTAQAGIGSVDGYNIPDSHNPVVFRFNSGDQSTTKWYPQGISGSDSAGHPSNKHFLVVSWYGREDQQYEHKGVRISFMDATNPSNVKYRHVLLVQDKANTSDPDLFKLTATQKGYYTQLDDYAPVPIHAGGIAWVGNYLYVADTTLGIRQFDLTKMLPASADSTKKKCGVDGSGTFYAFDYRYILPQRTYYKTTGTEPNSCISLDQGTPRTLWTGQYIKAPSTKDAEITRFQLKAASDDIDTNIPLIQKEPKDKRGGTVNFTQGVQRDGSRTWLSITGQSSYEGSNARLITWEDGDTKGKRWRWPHGAEDLYYDEDLDRMWCLMEHPDRRAVFGVERSTYPMPTDTSADSAIYLLEDNEEDLSEVLET